MDNDLNILLITTNGITREFESWPERLQARALAKKGHTVRAYTYLGNRDWNKARFEIIDRVTVKRLRRYQWFSPDLIKALLTDPLPDIVHLHHLSNQLNFLAIVICKLRGVPVVMTPHGLFHDAYLVGDRDRPFDTPAKYKEIIRTIPQLLKSLRKRFKPKSAIKNYLTHAPLRLVNRVIVLSKHGEEVLIKLGIDKSRIEIIPNAIDPDWLEGITPTPKSHDELRVLFLGQLKYRKGFDILAHAITPVIEKLPQTRFIFAGHSPIHRQALLDIVNESWSRGYVLIPEHTSDQEKAALFLSSDLYILPTRYEGFGIPIIEAMSAGCPVISSDIPVINEIIQNEDNGLLFKYEDVKALSDTIIHALENPLLRNKLAANGKRSVQQYYTPVVVEQLEKLYREVIEEQQKTKRR